MLVTGAPSPSPNTISWQPSAPDHKLNFQDIGPSSAPSLFLRTIKLVRMVIQQGSRGRMWWCGGVPNPGGGGETTPLLFLFSIPKPFSNLNPLENRSIVP